MTSLPPENWGEESGQVVLDPEQIINWLEGYRELMVEVWQKNPELRREWELLNQAPVKMHATES